LVLAFDVSQLITQAHSFGAGLFGFGGVLDSANASHCVEDFGHGVALAVLNAKRKRTRWRRFKMMLTRRNDSSQSYRGN
jgi:hypothetical protein